MRKVITTTALCLVLGAGAFGFGTATQASSRPVDPSMPWIALNGQLDRSKLPDCFVALDTDGNPKKDAKGKTVCIPSAEIYPEDNQVKPTKDDKSVKSRRMEGGVEIIEVEPKIKP